MKALLYFPLSVLASLMGAVTAGAAFGVTALRCGDSGGGAGVGFGMFLLAAVAFALSLLFSITYYFGPRFVAYGRTWPRAVRAHLIWFSVLTLIAGILGWLPQPPTCGGYPEGLFGP